MSTSTDVFIIGGGQAGIPLALALAEADLRVVLAERRYLGGTCVNYGCTPTKAVLASARLAHQARRASEYGLHVPEVAVDFGAVIRRAEDILMESRTGLQEGLDGADRVRLVRGHARLAGREGMSFAVEVDGERFAAPQVVVNTGARSRRPDIEGLDDVDVLHAGNWLEQRVLPEHVLMVGGGYVGLEMGQFYRRMGSEVTVVHEGDRVAPHEDDDVAEALQGFLADEGLTFRTAHTARRVRRDGEAVVLTVEGPDGATDELRGSHLFLAAGRQPNTDDLGLDTVGLATDARGFLDADARLGTAVDGIWAAGDVRGGPLFTHTSYDDFRVLRSQLLGDGHHTTDRVVPYALFTDPELGRVGLTEAEARDRGYDVQGACYDLEKNGKARELGETKGFVKVVVDAATDRLLGAAVLAAEGSEIVHPYVTLMNADVSYQTMRDAVHIHPTLSEAVQSVLQDLG